MPPPATRVPPRTEAEFITVGVPALGWMVAVALGPAMAKPRPTEVEPPVAVAVALAACAVPTSMLPPAFSVCPALPPM